MSFNSIDFAVFLPISFLLYWSFKDKFKVQNIILVIISYFFYAWWDYRFLGLILISTLVDYFSAKHIYNNSKQWKKKVSLMVSLSVNLGMLFMFKYYDFFIDSLVNSFVFFGHKIRITNLNIILPVGISFYTFQTLSYTIDVYRKKLKPTSDLVAFMGYVNFFPQLVAGPIEKANWLLPQFLKSRQYSYCQFKDGFYQMIWGLFKKIAIADTLGIYVDEIFGMPSQYNSLILLFGVFYFSIQIYADFSGYSDIAIGVAKLFGFKLKDNFRMPNFSRDPAEYWRRWHISLSEWFKDYLYIPLGGSKGSRQKVIRNIFIIFLVSGFWHGADWTFIIWGFLNGLLFLPLILTNNNRKNLNGVAESRLLPTLRESFQVVFTFTLISLTRIFFRSVDIDSAFVYSGKLLSFSLDGSWNLPGIQRYFFEVIPLIVVFTIYEWVKRNKQSQMISNWLELTIVITGILVFGVFNNHESFIYFQF